MDIAIIMHEKSRKYDLRRYAIIHMARAWLEDGHHVFILFGCTKYVAADVAILHVDLSIVPHEYIEFSKQYPIVVNGSITDIRKKTYSVNQLDRDSSYDGKVIVKSNYNFAGIPERMVGVAISIDHSNIFKSSQDYKVFDELKNVPDLFFGQDFIVEKFIPEKFDDKYAMRSYSFLGDNEAFYMVKSSSRVIRASDDGRPERIDPDPEIVEWRKKLGFDYGKFDYVIHEGRVHLLDANKLLGIPKPFPGLEEAMRERSKGLYSFMRK